MSEDLSETEKGLCDKLRDLGENEEYIEGFILFIRSDLGQRIKRMVVDIEECGSIVLKAFRILLNVTANDNTNSEQCAIRVPICGQFAASL